MNSIFYRLQLYFVEIIFIFVFVKLVILIILFVSRLNWIANGVEIISFEIIILLLAISKIIILYRFIIFRWLRWFLTLLIIFILSFFTRFFILLMYRFLDAFLFTWLQKILNVLSVFLFYFLCFQLHKLINFEMKVETFFLKHILIISLKLLVDQDNASIYILSVEWIKLFIFLVAVICYEIKWNKWILFYFLVL